MGKSPEGHDFWYKVINNENFDVFFEKYPKKDDGFVVGEWYENNGNSLVYQFAGYCEDDDKRIRLSHMKQKGLRKKVSKIEPKNSQYLKASFLPMHHYKEVNAGLEMYTIDDLRHGRVGLLKEGSDEKVLTRLMKKAFKYNIDLRHARFALGTTSYKNKEIPGCCKGSQNTGHKHVKRWVTTHQIKEDSDTSTSVGNKQIISTNGNKEKSNSNEGEGSIESESGRERQHLNVSQLGRRGEGLDPSDRRRRESNLNFGEGRRRCGEGIRGNGKPRRTSYAVSES